MNTVRAPHLLAVAYGGGHIAMVLPVLRALRQQQPRLRITLLALTTAARAARAAGESPLGYADLLHLLDAEERAQALALGRAMLAGNTHPDVAEAESIAYLGVNAWDLQQQVGTQAAQRLLTEKGRHGFYPLHFFRRVMAHLRPDLLLTTNSPRSEQAAIDAATDAGIPSLALLDLFALPGDAFAARTRYPSRVCVLSEAVRDNLVAAGWPADRIAITGNPAFDALDAPQTRAAGTALRRTLLGAAQRLLLLALQPEPVAHPAAPGRRGDPALPARIVQAAVQAVRAHPDWRLIVRPHPSQPPPALPADAQLRLSPPAEPLHPLLHAVDLVITGTSTVALEAHLAGCRVLQLRDSITAAAVPYKALGIADAECLAAELPDALPMLLAAGRRPPTSNDTAPAAEKVGAVALDLLGARCAPALNPTQQQTV
jgi:hypothetical protein